MKKFGLFALLLLCFGISSFAQENEATPYQAALQRIEEARVSGATYLDLSGIGLGSDMGTLAELPPEIGELIQLERLNLNYNQLTSLPTEIGNLINLRSLHLYRNNLQNFPPEIGNLVNLRVITASYNQIESLPPEIGNLTQLEVLNLNGNRLRELPIEIGQLTNLCMLWIADNQISRLPAELGQLSGLLSPENCPAIEEFHLSQEYGLNIDNLPLVYPPAEILAQGDATTIIYLRDEEWWHLQKLIAGGASSIGLVAALILGFRWKNRRGRKEKAKRS